MKPEKRIELTNRLNPEAVALARWVCLATRIEPALIRRARLHLMPGGNSGTESDLWFSPLIQTVGARYILLYPEVSNLLRRQLAGNRKDLARAWKVTRQTHRSLPELVRLEEKLTWLALKDDLRLERKFDALLRPLIKAILTGQREGLGRWALNVVPHLPERARASKSARLLRVIAESQLYGGWANLLTTIGDAPTDEEAALLLHGLERTTVGLRLRGDSLEVSEPPEEGARLLKVPATNPRVIELSWLHNGETGSARVMWKKGEQGRAAGVSFPLSVNTLAGDSHQLIQGTQIIESHRRMVAPYLVSILDANNQAVGLGILVENDFILTSNRSLQETNPNNRDIENQSVGFPLLRPETIALTKTAGSAPSFGSPIPWTELVSADYPELLKLHAPASGTRAAKLKPAFDLKGRVLLAPGMPPGGMIDKWAAFEVGEATETGDFALLPATQIKLDNLSRWSGAPLVDSSTWEVAGLLLVNKSEDAHARLVSLDQIARAFPEIFNAGSTVLLSYSQRDHEHVKEFRFRMEALGLGDKLVFWVDSRLSEPPWMEQTALAMESATAVVLFVSADYLASDFMVKDDFPQLVTRAEKRGAIILPVILGPSDFSKTTLTRYRAVNDPSEPFTTLSSEERAQVFQRLAEILSKQLGVKTAESSRSQPEFTKDFFISSHQADKAWAEWIAWQLEEAGYSTFLPFRDIERGDIAFEVRRMIEQSARTVAVLSPDYLNSTFTQEEAAAALALDPTGQTPRVLPVRVREVMRTPRWDSIMQLDLVGLSEQEASAKLLNDLNRGYLKPIGGDARAKRSLEPVPFPIPAPAPTPEPRPSRLTRGFSTDIFISFARLDNEPFGSEKGWVYEFVERLTNRLSQVLGGEPDVWWDQRLQDNQYFAGQLGDRLSGTRLFISIITPRYVNSEWCLGELREFHRRAAETGGVRIGDRSRIFTVQKTPVARETLPVELRDFVGYSFYELNDQGRAQEFSPQIGRNKDQRYWDKLDDLAWDIKTTLESIKHAEPAPQPADVTPRRPADVMVYLAETTTDLRNERELIRNELLQRGYGVLPEHKLPSDDVRKTEEAVRADLSRCALSVHLVGSRYGPSPEDDARSVVRIQDQLAAEHAVAKPAFMRLLWMPPGLLPTEITDERQKSFVSEIQNRITPGAELLQRGIEDLKTRIVEKLSHSPNPHARSEEDTRLKSIYFICDKRDRALVRHIKDYLFKNNFEVVTWVDDEGTGATLLDYHRKNLKGCDAALIYFGNADESWVRRNLEDLEKAYGYGREVDWSATAVYVGPPWSDQKEDFLTHMVPYVIRNRGEFNPGDLSEFVAAVKAASSGQRTPSA